MKKMIFIVLFTVLFLFSACGKPDQTVTELVVELGEEVPVNADAYFNITEKQLKHFSMDLSQIDISECGVYEIPCSYKNETYTIKIEIKDTIAPALKEGYSFEIECAKLIEISDLDIVVVDESDWAVNFSNKAMVSYGYTGEAEGEESVDYVYFNKPGHYKLELIITDEYGNRNVSSVEIVAQDTTAPIFDTLETLEVDYGASIDLLDGVTAIDTVDGDVSANITVTEIDTSTSGEQICKYTVSDAAGNVTEMERTVIVKEKPKATTSSSLARSTSLECKAITVTYSYRDSDDTFTRAYPANVTVGEVWAPSRDNEGVMLCVSEIFLGFSNGTVSLAFNMGEICNINGDDNALFWSGRKIVAHQEIYVEGYKYDCYMLEKGRVMMDTEGYRISMTFLPEQMVEWFGPYGYDAANWVYY